MHEDELFGTIIKKFLRRSKFTSAYIASKTGIPEGTIKTWKKKRVKQPRANRWPEMVRLAAFLGLNSKETDELLHAAGHPSLHELPYGELKGEVENKTREAIAEIEAAQTGYSVNMPLHVNVPPKPNLLVGRSELVSDLVQRLISSHTLAISSQRVTGVDKSKIAMDGLPGIGKTAMAIALAHHPVIRDHFTGGVLWGGLGQQPDAMRILAQWGEELGRDVSKLTTEKGRAQVIGSAIGQRPMLIVIDDAWDVKSAGYLRCGGPNCCHLLTTRNFQIAREFAGLAQVESIPVLDKIASWQLLEALAPEVCTANPDAVELLIGRAGGLPLTLVLLGGFLAAPEHSMFEDLSLQTLYALDELSDPLDPVARLRLAMERLGSLADKELTLQETITLSLEVLPEEIQGTFHSLGAFAPKPEWFGRDAAEFVTETNSRTLATLVARNLVERISDTELALHQVLADTARIKTPIYIVDRHRDYYLSRVNGNQEDWQWIESVYGQIKWAWEFTPNDSLFDFHIALGDHQYVRGLWSDLVGWIQRSIYVAKSQGDQANTGILLNNLGQIYSNQSRWADAEQMLIESLEIRKKLGDRGGESQTLNNLGIVYKEQSRYGEAIHVYQMGLCISKDLDNKLMECISLNNLASVYENLGDFDKATKIYLESLNIRRELGDRSNEAIVLGNLGTIYSKLNQYEDALQVYRDSLDIHREFGNRHGESSSLYGLGRVYEHLGRYEEALQNSLESLSIRKELGDRGGEANVLQSVGLIYANQGHDDEAMQSYNASLLLSRALEDHRGESITLNNLASIYYRRGQYNKAIQMFKESHHVLQKLGDRYHEGIALDNLGFLLKKLNNFVDAMSYYEQALIIHQEVLGDDHPETKTVKHSLQEVKNQIVKK